MKNTNVEVEGGEILIQSKEGHYAVIPAKHRQEVMDMIKDGCDGCINSYIQGLPKEADYAEDGSLLPSWNKVKATLNPKNWGVTDYTDKGDFDSAYSSARQQGEKEFMWNNQRKSTKSDMNEAQQMKSYGITDNQRITNPSRYRKNLSDLNTIDGYNIPLMNVVDRSLNKNKEEDFSNEPNSPAAKEQDALRLYLGLPQKANTFKPSKYKTGAFELNNYLEKLPDIMPSDEEIDYYGKPLSQKEFHKNKGNKKINVADNYSGNTLKPLEDFVMGKHTVKKGKDEKGEYIEYIDEFDFDTYKYNFLNGKIPFTDKTFNLDIPLGDISDKINKPYSIYGRKYYKDYGDGQKKTMYYSDKELSELNVNKRNFDTLALQRELSNRGVKLPKSTTKEGTFDGIWGEETKQALLDYQTKNKKK